MTQEEKQILLKDLCSRLPYGVYVHFSNTNIDEILTSIEIDEENINKTRHNGKGNHCKVIPYLRPMSSMTEEEKIEWETWHERLEEGRIKDWKYADFLDWLNAHHFDYRGLIEKGLALEAPKGMYEN